MTNTHDKSEMKACPFCGTKLVGTIEQGFGHSIESPDCILQYHYVDSHDTERWNTRASCRPADRVPAASDEIGKLLLHGTLTLSGSQIIVDFNNRENAEAFFDALESTIHQSEEE